MNLPPQRMTGTEAERITRQIVMEWPQPELDHDGLLGYVQGIADTGLTHAQAERAHRLMRITHGQFRPRPSELLTAHNTITTNERRHRDTQPVLPPPPRPTEQQLTALREAKNALNNARHTP